MADLNEERAKRRIEPKSTRDGFNPPSLEKMNDQLALYAAMSRHPEGKGRTDG